VEVLCVTEDAVEGHHAGAVQGLVHDELAGVRHGRITGPADHQQPMVVVDRGRRLDRGDRPERAWSDVAAQRPVERLGRQVILDVVPVELGIPRCRAIRAFKGGAGAAVIGRADRRVVEAAQI
jgi:hypothetical protein